MSNKADKIAEAAKRILAKLSGEPSTVTVKFIKEGTTAEGVKIMTEADDWSEGVEVFVEIDGVVSPAPDGEHVVGDVKITVAEGKITAVSAIEEEVSEEVEAAIEAALSAVVKDRDKYAAELTAKNDAITRMAAELAAKDSEITNLKAQVVTLSKQIGSVQDAPAHRNTAPVAAPAEQLDAKGRPQNWAKLNTAERIKWNRENLTIKSK